MTSLGIQAWVQLLSGFRMAFAHAGLAEPFNVLQVLGNSYRLASTTGGGSSVVYGRFTVGFCRAIVARMLGADADAGVLMETRLDCSWWQRTQALRAAAKEPAVSLRPCGPKHGARCHRFPHGMVYRTGARGFTGEVLIGTVGLRRSGARWCPR